MGSQRLLVLLSLLIATTASCSSEPETPSTPAQVAEADYVTTDSGLKYHDLKKGIGPVPRPGLSVKVHYTGWLTDGRIFDSSVIKGKPYEFVLGSGRVIKGWEEGVASMNVGTKRQLVVPPDLGYGSQGAGSVIPPNATLVFEIELLEIR